MLNKTRKKLWMWLVVLVALIFFLFLALLPFDWEQGDNVPAPNPTVENG